MALMFSSGARLKEELGPVIESKELALTGLQKNYLRARWLDQSARAEASYRRALKGFYALRVMTVIGATALPVLTVLSVGVAAPDGWTTAVRVLTVLSGLLVSACVAVEHLFDVGGRYRRSERVAGRLQTEGWRFLQLSGPYACYGTHSEAFPAFASQVEALSQRDVEVYNFDVVHERALADGGAEGAAKKFKASRQGEAELLEPQLLMTGSQRSRQSFHQTQ